jgi:hypothetical protein
MDVPETAAEGWRSEGEVEILMAALPDAKGKGYQEDVWYSGKVYRDNSKSGKDAKAAWEAAMAKHAGYYTVSLVAPDAMPGEPRGSGYITLTLDAKGKAKLAGKRVCDVGYSVARATESAVGTDGLLKEYEGWTNKFLFPPYEFDFANSMVVNFYHPESPMLMATCTFGGYDLVMKAYQLAVENGYKFGCFGDALLMLDD